MDKIYYTVKTEYGDFEVRRRTTDQERKDWGVTWIMVESCITREDALQSVHLFNHAAQPRTEWKEELDG